MKDFTRENADLDLKMEMMNNGNKDIDIILQDFNINV